MNTTDQNVIIRRTPCSRLKAACYSKSATVAGLVFLGTSCWAGGVVTDCTEANLRAAMTGGGLVTFACDGAITLASTINITQNTFLDATGHQVTISGGDSVRIFYVPTNVTFTLNRLTIAHGRNTNGAGIFNDHGTVNATNTSFESNAVVGVSGTLSWPGIPGESVGGGAVANAGTINLFDCIFRGNQSKGGDGSPGVGGEFGFPGGTGAGGAMWNSGLLTASGCTFAGNTALGGSGGQGSSSSPEPGSIGYPGGPGGDGAGAALFNNGISCLVNCTFGFNSGVGGPGGPGGPSYPSPGNPYPPPGPSGAAGFGVGGIDDPAGQCSLTNCTLALNSGAGIRTPGAHLVNTLLSDNSPGGNCSGGISDLGHNLSSDTTCAFTNAGSMNNTYPLLGPLMNNGGFTATFALLAGCRAIDAGDTAAAPPFDQRGVARPFGSAADIGAYEYDSVTNSTMNVVTEATEASLRAAMSGGGTISFACDGTILLTHAIAVTTNTVLDAGQHQVAISAGGSNRVFEISSGVTFSLANLAVVNGSGSQGGAILSSGLLQATNCLFAQNCASMSGGAIRNQGGDVVLVGCVFTNNSVIGATGTGGAAGGSVFGGALENSGTLAAELCRFVANKVMAGSATGGPGGAGGSAGGGAICNWATLTVSRCTFTNNSAWGGFGATGSEGHHGDPGMDAGDGGRGGAGGNGDGGAIYTAGNARVEATTLVSNTGTAGNGGAGGQGGASYGSGRGGNGGAGGSGGNGVGALFNSGLVNFINSTLALNVGSGGSAGNGGAGGDSQAIAGDGGAGGNGGSGCGALSDESSSALTNVTLAMNAAYSGSAGTGGAGGYGVYQSGTAGASGSPGLTAGGFHCNAGKLLNTLVSENLPGGNCRGVVTDSGHNLSSDATCGFTNASSMNSTPACLGPLTNNGGPTLTMALLPGSPAIDAGDPAASLASDQRGYPRPAGSAPDIGAFEFGSVMPVLTAVRGTGSVLTLLATGNAGQSCRLLTSSDLVHWQPAATNQFGGEGTALFQEQGGGACRFYRLVMP